MRLSCRACGHTSLRSFLSLGDSPLANRLPSRAELELPEPVFPLTLVFCDGCAAVQLSEVVPPELLFKNYLYVTSTTQTFRDHFNRMADEIVRDFALDADALAVDIGSNDGLLLRGFQRHGVRAVGVEPAENLASAAQASGVPTINAFFDAAAVKRILEEYGRANVVTANNVFPHIDDIVAVARNVQGLLRDDGIFVIEFAYLFDMLDQLTFDLIYHEHLSYFALAPLVAFFDRVDMDVFDVRHVESHGGSLRVFVQRKGGPRPRTSAVADLLELESRRGVRRFATYEGFARSVYGVRAALEGFFSDARKGGRRVVGFGMPAKATTLLAFCDIGREAIEYIVDENPLKQGRYTPVSHIPIVGPERLEADCPDYIVVLAWNFAEEILKKLARYRSRVEFVIPLPKPRVV